MDTPRTDAAEVRMERLDGDFDHVVPADFARTLERELAQANARIAELEELLTKIGDYAHDRSTGPTVWDALWEVRRMAYEEGK